MPNGINTISPTIRDFLLNRNLILSDTITQNGLTALASGLGQPAQISTMPESIQASENIVDNGAIYRDLNIINNPYAPISGNELVDIQTYPLNGNLPPNTSQLEYPTLIGSQTQNSPFNIANDLAREQVLYNQYQPNSTPELVSIGYNPTNYTESNGGYLDNNNNLNIGGPSTTALDFIGGVLGGDFVGMDGRPSFDIRSSLAGRVLGATGAINDTPLGVIAQKELLTALANKVAFNVQRETLGQLNLNPLSLLSGNEFIVPNYSITVGQTTGKKIGDVALNVFGVETPTSYLFDVSSSIFYKENNSSTKDRIDAQIKNTGKGQAIILFSNLNENKYRLGFEDSRIKGGVNENLYVFRDGSGGILDNTKDSLISNSNINLEGMIESSGFETIIGKGIGDADFVWADDKLNTDPMKFAKTSNEISSALGGTNFIQKPNTIFNNPNTLLGKTQELFNSGLMRVLVSGHGAQMSKESEISTFAKVGSTFYQSKGSGVLSQDAIDGTGSAEPSNVFCRTWTPIDRYDQVYDLQKHSGLSHRFGLRQRNTPDLSVLDDNGFVRIAPNIGDDELNSNNVPTNIKRFMFSLENLAWSDDYNKLPATEKGPGDPVTGTKGRIMWFPPYDLKFNESTSANWDSHSFIGRGEPLYTYNNSERSGSLSFKVIIDHAAYINEMRGEGNNDLFASIAAGCYEFDLDKVKNLTKDEQDIIDVNSVSTPDTILDNNQEEPEPFFIYFPNDVSNLDKYVDYEMHGDGEFNPVSGLTWTQADDGYNSVSGRLYEDRFDYGLNKNVINPTFISELKDKLLKECPACRVEISGYASKDGTKGPNDRLSEDRANSIRDWFLRNGIFIDDSVPTEQRFIKVSGEGEIGCPKNSGSVDSYCKKTARKVKIIFKYDPIINEANVKVQQKKDEDARTNKAKKDLATNIKSRFFNEALYFQKLAQSDKTVYKTIGEKIKFFHPAFHSITPEGFNSRLNFLEQCTRQGPTKAGTGPNNLVFGMAPVVILRIGDFYHTKIIIDSLDIDFDSGSGVQWDLNPEGIGVQPMIANVSIGFKFIGGHSLQGPINKLQNAVSFNFFANTEVYDPRADYIKFNTDVNKNAEYVNDLDNGNLFDILNDVVADANDTLPNDQISVSETANSEIITDEPYTKPSETPIDLKLLLKSVRFTKTLTNIPMFLIYGEQKGMYNVSGSYNEALTNIAPESEIEKFVKKGVKISISNDKGVLVHEVIIPYGNDFKDLFIEGFKIINNNFSTGMNYIVSLYHNGRKVNSINVN